MTIQRIRLTQVKSNNASYGTFEDQIAGMSVPHYEEFIAVDGQTTITLAKSYKMGNNSLKVFLNGMYQDEGTANSYVEVDSTSVKFNFPLVAGDWVMCRVEGAGSGTTLENHIHHVREVPTGLVDGSNKVFSLAYTPQLGSEHVYKNGMLMFDGSTEDYTISGNTITFATAPDSGSKILATYITG